YALDFVREAQWNGLACAGHFLDGNFPLLVRQKLRFPRNAREAHRIPEYFLGPTEPIHTVALVSPPVLEFRGQLAPAHRRPAFESECEFILRLPEPPPSRTEV